MKILRKAIGLFCFVLFILLAATGIGIANALTSANRERQLDNEIRIEQVDRKAEDEDESKDEKD